MPDETQEGAGRRTTVSVDSEVIVYLDGPIAEEYKLLIGVRPSRSQAMTLMWKLAAERLAQVKAERERVTEDQPGK